MPNCFPEFTISWWRLLRVPPVVLVGLLLSVSLFAQSSFVDRTDLSGYWRFALDRNDAGVTEQWFGKNMTGYFRLPGILQSQYGDEISTSTPWVLSLYDRYWYLREDYKQYTD